MKKMIKDPQFVDDLKTRLTPEQFEVIVNKDTEQPFQGKYLYNHAAGQYVCAACGTLLFKSDTKFDSGTGWPSFTDPATLQSVELREDKSHDAVRIEVACKKCGAHLGHVFDDGPNGKQRYCVNSCAMDFMMDISA